MENYEYQYGKEFDSFEKLVVYLGMVENLTDAKITKGDELGKYWVLQFNK